MPAYHVPMKKCLHQADGQRAFCLSALILFGIRAACILSEFIGYCLSNASSGQALAFDAGDYENVWLPDVS